MGDLILECFKSDSQRGLQELIAEGYINETDFFAIILNSSTRLPITDLVILITDFPFELEERFLNGKFFYVLSENSLRRYFREEGFDFRDYSKVIDGVKMSKLFVNYPIGISEIQLYNNKTETLILESKINVVSDKLNEGEFINLVNYVESKSVFLWAQYSLLKNEALPNEAINKNDWQLLYLQQLINDIWDKIYSFQYDKLTTYKKENCIASYTSELLIDEDSVYWLSQNLDTLSVTKLVDNEKIVIQSRLFHPNEILTPVTSESTDIIENRFIHGFINELIKFVTSRKEGLKDFGYSLENRSFLEILEFYSQNRKHRLFLSYLKNLENIRSYLSDFIPVTELVLDYIPTHRLDSKNHYQFIYERFVEWFSFNRIKFSNNKLYFKGVTRMDLLFERACLYKLIDVFISLGYVSEVKSDNKGVPQIIKFTQEESRRFHIMYFETYPDKFETQNNRTTLKPDFFIEFDNASVLILDAKYKKNYTVQKYDWEKLTLKYLHGIGYKGGGKFSPVALLALIPASNNHIEFYQSRKYDLFSQSPAFPAIGSLVVDFNDKFYNLERCLKRIIDLVY